MVRYECAILMLAVIDFFEAEKKNHNYLSHQILTVCM